VGGGGGGGVGAGVGVGVRRDFSLLAFPCKLGQGLQISTIFVSVQL